MWVVFGSYIFDQLLGKLYWQIPETNKYCTYIEDGIFLKKNNNENIKLDVKKGTMTNFHKWN